MVAKMNFTWGGGSSSVLSRPLLSSRRQHMHSSMMNLVGRRDRAVLHRVDDLRMSLMPVLRGVHFDDDVDVAAPMMAAVGIPLAVEFAAGWRPVSSSKFTARANACRGCLAHAANAGEHESVGEWPDLKALRSVCTIASWPISVEKLPAGISRGRDMSAPPERAAAVIGAVGKQSVSHDRYSDHAAEPQNQAGKMWGSERLATTREGLVGACLPDLTRLARNTSAPTSGPIWQPQARQRKRQGGAGDLPLTLSGLRRHREITTSSPMIRSPSRTMRSPLDTLPTEAAGGPDGSAAGQ